MSSTFPLPAFRRATICSVVAAAFAPVAWAATSDVAPAPLETSMQAVVKPNLMLVLDDSGSMARDYMPDDRGSSSRCFGYFGYNRIFYNPSLTYVAPVKADGTSYPNASFTAARVDGFDTSSRTRDLSNTGNLSTPTTEGCDKYGRNCGDRFYYSTLNNGAANDCTKNNYSVVTDASSWTAAQKTNYANWYSYYRTRTLLMRSAVGRAFKSVGDTYRVGFSTISETSVDDGDLFLNVRDFNSSQKTSFYEKLYAAQPSGYTPLRASLSKIGRYFANKETGQKYDPIQYSCQQSFTILSTDGYWNDATDDDYRLKDLAGELIGNVDSVSASVPTPPTPINGRTSKTSRGPSNTLADVAYYYYETDLRDESLKNCTGSIPNTLVCENNVEGAGKDLAKHQHMTTFTLGLGVDGTLPYLPNYEAAGSGAYYDIVQGTRFWPDPTKKEDGTRIDDLWHAAVNGRGKYFSAGDPTSLVSGLTDALTGISARVGASASAATSTLQPVQGNNSVYVAQYETKNWVGDLLAYTIDPNSGVVDSKTPAWSAQAKLNSALAGTGHLSRKVYFAAKAKSGSWSREDFKLDKLKADIEGLDSYFLNACSKAPALSQCASTLTDSQKSLANDGTNLVNWLRGDAAYESGSNAIYRARTARLGDIVNASPVYVGPPPFPYADVGYADFKSSKKTRTAMIYAAANDGMLHAFNTEGAELWAYVPREVMPKLYRMADVNYSANHQWSVDGSPVVGDIKVGNGNSSSSWKTILVGGLNAGGRGYYALDVTDPLDPQVLWEFTETDLGLSFGNPAIAKRADGTWVVIFASGLNNVNAGSGNGYLYVLDAGTGRQLLKIPTYTSGTTPAGDSATPSGLAKINVWVDNEADNTAKRVYGGDMLGNVWRFDLDNLVAPNRAALRLAQLRIDGVPQPITTKPELAEVDVGGSKKPVVFVGTGRYLGTSDLADTQKQSVYAIKDPLTATGWGDVRASGSTFRARTLSKVTDGGRRAEGSAVNFANDGGWFIDLPSSGERINVDLQQQLGVLTVASNIPKNDACTAGGESWLYNLDITTGLALSGATDAGVWLGNALTAGLRVVQLTTGRTRIIVTDATGKVKDADGGSGGGATAASARRTSWRELAD